MTGREGGREEGAGCLRGVSKNLREHYRGLLTIPFPSKNQVPSQMGHLDTIRADRELEAPLYWIMVSNTFYLQIKFWVA